MSLASKLRWLWSNSRIKTLLRQIAASKQSMRLRSALTLIFHCFSSSFSLWLRVLLFSYHRARLAIFGSVRLGQAWCHTIGANHYWISLVSLEELLELTRLSRCYILGDVGKADPPAEILPRHWDPHDSYQDAHEDTAFVQLLCPLSQHHAKFQEVRNDLVAWGAAMMRRCEF